MEKSGKSSSYMWSCGVASPSWFPPHCQPPSAFHVLGHNRELEEEEETIDVYCRSRSRSRSSRRWREVLKGLLRRKGSLICSSCNHHSSPTTTTTTNNFGYDAVSYAKNFDDGLLDDDNYHSYYLISSSNNARCSGKNHTC